MAAPGTRCPSAGRSHPLHRRAPARYRARTARRPVTQSQPLSRPVRPSPTRVSADRPRHAARGSPQRPRIGRRTRRASADETCVDPADRLDDGPGTPQGQREAGGIRRRPFRYRDGARSTTCDHSYELRTFHRVAGTAGRPAGPGPGLASVICRTRGPLDWPSTPASTTSWRPRWPLPTTYEISRWRGTRETLYGSATLDNVTHGTDLRRPQGARRMDLCAFGPSRESVRRPACDDKEVIR